MSIQHINESYKSYFGQTKYINISDYPRNNIIFTKIRLK